VRKCANCGENEVKEYLDERYCETCNTEIAGQIQAAMEQHKPDGWTVKAVNMGNVNIDITIYGPNVCPWIFRYCAVWWVWEQLSTMSIDRFAVDFMTKALASVNDDTIVSGGDHRGV
jgi:hypothetical protein